MSRIYEPAMKPPRRGRRRSRSRPGVVLQNEKTEHQRERNAKSICIFVFSLLANPTP